MQDSKSQEFAVRGDYITLSQLLKATGIVSIGSEVKDFLAEEEIWVNGEPEMRRGKKLRPGDVVTFSDGSKFLMTSEAG
jgi:ribosome-associated protein